MEAEPGVDDSAVGTVAEDAAVAAGRALSDEAAAAFFALADMVAAAASGTTVRDRAVTELPSTGLWTWKWWWSVSRL